MEEEGGSRWCERVRCGGKLVPRTTWFKYRGAKRRGWGVTTKTKLMRTLQLARPLGAVPRLLPVAAMKRTKSTRAAHPALRAKRRTKQRTTGLPHTLVKARGTTALQKTTDEEVVAEAIVQHVGDPEAFADDVRDQESSPGPVKVSAFSNRVD